MSGTSLIRQLQLAELDILKEVISVCERHNLRYTMIGGTMLGAIRHKGFIPWDDDIDIALPRKDYNAFINYALKELPYPYKILNSNGTHPCMFIKVHNVETTFIESSTVNWQEYYKGVFVDIMPLDGMPEDEKKRKKFCKKLSGLVKAFNWHRFDFKYCKSLKAKLCYLIPEKWIFKTWQKTLLKYDFDSSSHTCFSWSHRPNRMTFKTSFFKETENYCFENLRLKGPKDFNGYLTKHFNADYMQLPPEEERQSHSCGGVINLETPYENYYKKGEK